MTGEIIMGALGAIFWIGWIATIIDAVRDHRRGIR